LLKCMFTNVNLSAPIGAMAFLGAVFFVLVAAVVFVYALVTRRLVLARGVPTVAVILAAT